MRFIVFIILAFIMTTLPNHVFGHELIKKKSLRGGLMRLEVTKVYRTSMTVNMAENYTQYLDLAKPQNITLQEAIDAREKQKHPIAVGNPKSYEVYLSSYQNGIVTLTVNLTGAASGSSSSKSNSPPVLKWIKFDTKGIAGPTQTLGKPIELRDGDTIEISGESNLESSQYEVSFRFQIVN